MDERMVVGKEYQDAQGDIVYLKDEHTFVTRFADGSEVALPIRRVQDGLPGGLVRYWYEMDGMLPDDRPRRARFSPARLCQAMQRYRGD
jgi:hypothetical protein